ncbi:MAG: carbohydrate kinase family protein [Solirubrobacteraceae bacterium]
MTVLMFAETLVDLVCPEPVSRPADASTFVPRLGGAGARTAVAAASRGAHVALAGGVGDDEWGAWLRGRLEDAGVDLTWFRLVAGERTPVAFRTVDAGGAHHSDLYGQSLDRAMDAVRPRIAEAVDATDGVWISAVAYVGERERQLADAARRRAVERDRPVVLDLDLDPERITTRETIDEVVAALEGVELVIATGRDAEIAVREADPAAAADALVAVGARIAVVIGTDAAVLRGAGVDRTIPVDGEVAERATIVGALVAALDASGWYPAAVAAELPRAIAVPA